MKVKEGSISAKIFGRSILRAASLAITPLLISSLPLWIEGAAAQSINDINDQPPSFDAPLSDRTVEPAEGLQAPHPTSSPTQTPAQPSELAQPTNSANKSDTASLLDSLDQALKGSTKSGNSQSSPFEVRVMLAESIYQREKNPINLMELISAYETLLGPLCMPGIQRDLYYDGPGKNERCRETITKLLALDVTNPTALCARDGIDSRSCRGAAAETVIGTYTFEDPGSGSSNGTELQARLVQARNQPAIEQLNTELETFAEAHKESASDEDRAYVDNLLKKLLNLSCVGTRTYVSEKSEVPQKNSDPIEDLLLTRATPIPAPDNLSGREEFEPFAAPSATPTPAIEKPKNYDHARLLWAECKKNVDRALRYKADFTLAICHQWGFYSPQCIEAKRRDNLAPSGKQGGDSKKSGLNALESF